MYCGCIMCCCQLYSIISSPDASTSPCFHTRGTPVPGWALLRMPQIRCGTLCGTRQRWQCLHIKAFLDNFVEGILNTTRRVLFKLLHRAVAKCGQGVVQGAAVRWRSLARILCRGAVLQWRGLANVLRCAAQGATEGAVLRWPWCCAGCCPRSGQSCLRAVAKCGHGAMQGGVV